jgi:uncharacterized protein (DUF58 family)
MIPAQRTYFLLLIITVVAAAIAFLLPFNNRLVIATGVLLCLDGLVLAMMAWDNWQSQSDRVAVVRYPLHRLSIGRDNPVILSVQSQSRPATVQIRDAAPQEHFSVTPATLTANIPAHTQQDFTYRAKPFRRGEYHWGAIHTRQHSRWQLAWMIGQIPQIQTVAVYPDLLGLRSLSIRLTLQSTGAMRQNRRRLGMGTEFSELREYSTGDDPRLIDWKATARRNRPLIRLLEPEQEQTLIILLDRGRLMTAQIQGLQRFDWGLNATLSLALAGLNRGDRVGVGIFDRTVHTWIPPERGQTHLNHLIERLTPIQPEFLEPDYLGAATALVSQQTRRALVVVITDVVDVTASAELLLALGRMTPRYLPFCVTLRDPQIDQQAHHFTADTSAAYSRAVALDLLAQREVAFATLKRKGVLVLDAPAQHITDQLVDRYLKLKLRNQL